MIEDMDKRVCIIKNQLFLENLNEMKRIEGFTPNAVDKAYFAEVRRFITLQ